MARVPEGITAEKFFCFYIILFAQKRRGLMSQWTENWCRFLRACQQGATPLVARTASNWFATSVNGFIMTLWSRRWFKVFFSSAWRPFRKRWSLLEGCGRESRMEGRGYLALRVTSGSRKPRRRRPESCNTTNPRRVQTSFQRYKIRTEFVFTFLICSHIFQFCHFYESVTFNLKNSNK